MVNVIGYQPEDVIGKSAYDFICPLDHKMSLVSHGQTLKNSDGTGVVVHRLRAIDNSYVFIQSFGKLEYTGETVLIHILTTTFCKEEGERIHQEYVEKLAPDCANKTIAELQYQVIEITESKLAELAKDRADSNHASSPSSSYTFSLPSDNALHDITPSRQIATNQPLVEFTPDVALSSTFSALADQSLKLPNNSPSEFLSAHCSQSTQESMQYSFSSPNAEPMSTIFLSSHLSIPETTNLSGQSQSEDKSLNEICHSDQYVQYKTALFKDIFAEQNPSSHNYEQNYTDKVEQIINDLYQEALTNSVDSKQSTLDCN